MLSALPGLPRLFEMSLLGGQSYRCAFLAFRKVSTFCASPGEAHSASGTPDLARSGTLQAKSVPALLLPRLGASYLTCFRGLSHSIAVQEHSVCWLPLWASLLCWRDALRRIQSIRCRIFPNCAQVSPSWPPKCLSFGTPRGNWSAIWLWATGPQWKTLDLSGPLRASGYRSPT